VNLIISVLEVIKVATKVNLVEPPKAIKQLGALKDPLEILKQEWMEVKISIVDHLGILKAHLVAVKVVMGVLEIKWVIKQVDKVVVKERAEQVHKELLVVLLIKVRIDQTKKVMKEKVEAWDPAELQVAIWELVEAMVQVAIVEAKVQVAVWELVETKAQVAIWELVEAKAQVGKVLEREVLLDHMDNQVNRLDQIE